MRIPDEILRPAIGNLNGAIYMVDYLNLFREDLTELDKLIGAQTSVVTLFRTLSEPHIRRLEDNGYSPDGDLEHLKTWRRKYGARPVGAGGHKRHTPPGESDTTQMDYMPALHAFVADANNASIYLAAGDEDALWEILEELKLTEFYVKRNCRTVLDRYSSKPRKD